MKEEGRKGEGEMDNWRNEDKCKASKRERRKKNRVNG